MAVIDTTDTQPDFFGFAAEPPKFDMPEIQEPTWSELGKAAFSLENDVVGFYDFVTQEAFDRDPDFNVVEAAKQSKWWNTPFRENFVRARSQAEFDHISAKIEQELKHRETLQAGGAAGFAAAMAAGVASPTLLIPLTLGSKTAWQGVRQGFAFTAAASAAQEIPIAMTQETRTPFESASIILSAGGIGAGLGAAVSYMSSRALARAQGRMAMPHNEVDIQHSGVQGTSSANLEIMPVEGRFQFTEGADDVTVDAERMLVVSEESMPLIEREVGSQDTGAIANWARNNFDAIYFEEVGGPKGLKVFDEANVQRSPSVDPENPIPFPTFNAGVHNVIQEAGVSATGSAAGAQATRGQSAGGLKSTLPGTRAAMEVAINTSPVARGIHQEVSPLGRNATTQISTGGLKLQLNQDGVASARGGTIEQRQLTYRAFDAKAVRAIDEAYNDYVFDGKSGGLFPRARSTIVGQLRNDKLSKAQFREQITLARFQGDDFGGPPQAKAVAARIGKEILDPILVKAQADDVNLIPRELREIADANYFSRIYDKVKIAARETQFIDFLAEHFLAKKQAAFSKAHGRLQSQLLNQDTLISELRLDNEGLDTLLNSLRESLEALTREAPEAIAEIDAQIIEAQKLRRSTLVSGDKKIEAEALIKELEELGGDDLKKLRRMRGNIQRRIKRVEKTRKLTPSKRGKRLSTQEGARRALKDNFFDKYREEGADVIDVRAGTADFTQAALDDARLVVSKIKGDQRGLINLDLLQGPRGPALTRTLADIPSEQLQDWLVMDAEQILRTYVRTLSADIEIARTFGTPDASQLFLDLAEERVLTKRAKEAELRSEEPEITDAKLEKEAVKIDKAYSNLDRDLRALLSRIRHERGIPENPDGIGARLGRTVMNLNTLRFMGSVAVSSIPDLARAVMKYGLIETFRDGIVPMITNIKALKMSAQEIEAAGGALDVWLHSRALLMADLLEQAPMGTTKAEQLIEFGSARIGLVALFDYWTTGMKQFSGLVANFQFARAVEAAGQGNATKEQLEFLSAGGIDPSLASRMWNEMLEEGKSNVVNGKRLPNTETWASDLQDAYRAFIVGEVDNTIITPGVERPLIVDANLGWRMVTQFKSFATSSTTKTMIAGLQQDSWLSKGSADFFVGTLMALSGGMMSYYIWANTVGGKAKTEMENAPIEKWIDEAIDRSGMLAVFNEAWRLAARVPGLNNPESSYRVTFSGRNTTRRVFGSDVFTALGGPSADAAKRAWQIGTGIHEPTQSTTYQAKTLTPYQNVFWLRRVFDEIKESFDEAFDIPKTRKQN